MGQAFVRGLHDLWDAFRLANLVASRKAAVEDFRNKYAVAIRIQSGQWVRLDAFPAGLCNLWGSVRSRIWNKTSISLIVVSKE